MPRGILKVFYNKKIMEYSLSNAWKVPLPGAFDNLLKTVDIFTAFFR